MSVIVAVKVYCSSLPSCLALCMETRPLNSLLYQTETVKWRSISKGDQSEAVMSERTELEHVQDDADDFQIKTLARNDLRDRSLFMAGGSEEFIGNL